VYIPRAWHWTFPVGITLLGFSIRQHFGNGFDVYFTMTVLHAIALMHSAYIWKAGELYQRYVTNLDSKYVVEKVEDWNTGKLVDIPITMNGQSIVYTQSVPVPKFDKERNFAVTLIRMYEYNPDTVDLTENKWVKTGKFVRAEFVGMLDKWRGHGIIDRAGDRKNAPYIVGRWEAVRLIAQGNPLPPLLR